MSEEFKIWPLPPPESLPEIIKALEHVLGVAEKLMVIDPAYFAVNPDEQSFAE